MVVVFLMGIAYAASCSISQGGADSGTIIQGRAFTVTASGLSGTGTANIILPSSGFSIDEDTTKSFSSSSISWSTPKATELMTNQQVQVSINQNGNINTLTCEPNPFDVVSPPYITATHTPSSATVNAGGTFIVSLTIQNTGGTTASITVGVTGTGMSITSENVPDTIPASGIGSGSITIKASTAGSQTASVVVSALNGNAVTKNVAVTVNVVGDGDAGVGGTGSTGNFIIGGETTEKDHEVTYGNIVEIIANEAGTYKAKPNKTVYEIEAIMKGGSRLTSEEKDALEGGPDMDVYKYILLDGKGVMGITLKLAIPRDWIEKNGLEKGDVVLVKKIDGKWINVDLAFLDSDTGNYYYEFVGSFGTLAIGANPKEETATKIVCNAPTGWSECIGGNQTRTVESLIDGKCIPQNDVQKCPPKQSLFWRSWIPKIVILALLAFIVTISYFIFRSSRSW